MSHAPAALRRLLDRPGAVAAPGVVDTITAQIAQAAGFEALYFSGGAFANAMGLPDLGTFTLTELIQAVERITALVDLPLIVDIDTGFGEAVNVARAVADLERAGVAAVHLEDQTMPKRCGHLEGKEIVPADEMMVKLVAAREARRNDLVIIARTDSRAVEGIDGAIERARLYLRAGADMIFPDALESAEEFEGFARDVKAPLLANMTGFGKSPFLTVEQLGDMGYKVTIFPATAFRAMLKTAAGVYREIRSSGTQASIVDSLMTRSEIYDLIGYQDYETLDQRIAESVSAMVTEPEG